LRKVTFGVGNSLDNFIARQDHAVDWLVWDEEVAALSAAFWKTIGMVVMGRKTYEVAVKSGTTSYPGVKNYVFSRTMRESPDEKVEIISEDVAQFVRKLKKRKGKGICVMGGGELAKKASRIFAPLFPLENKTGPRKQPLHEQESLLSSRFLREREAVGIWASCCRKMTQTSEK